MKFKIIDLGDRRPAIKNIIKNVSQNRLNDKVEVNDPTLNSKEESLVLEKFLRLRKSRLYKFNTKVAGGLQNLATGVLRTVVKPEGRKNLRKVSGPGIVTANHFSPFDSVFVRVGLGFPKLSIIIEPTNLKMPGFLGYMMTYSHTIPTSSGINYMARDFSKMIKDSLNSGRSILIYPEQEMWYNYRKPRPLQRGAYHYAAKFKVPIISCFITMKNHPTRSDPHEVRYTCHVLKPIFPDSNLPLREAAEKMERIDFKQKVACYEQSYHKKYTPKYEDGDVAGNYFI